MVRFVKYFLQGTKIHAIILAFRVTLGIGHLITFVHCLVTKG